MTAPIIRDGWDASHTRELIDQPPTVPGHWSAIFPDGSRFVFTGPEMPRYRAMEAKGECTIRPATRADVEADNAAFEARAKAECAKWGSE